MGRRSINGILWVAVPLAFALGVLAQRQGIPGALRDRLRLGIDSTRIPLEAPIWRDPVVLLVAGQSNAANHGQPRGRAGADSFALSSEGLFRLEDPLPGASGPGGSPWPHWAALQQRSRPGSQVVVAAIAQARAKRQTTL